MNLVVAIVFIHEGKDITYTTIIDDLIDERCQVIVLGVGFMLYSLHGVSPQARLAPCVMCQRGVDH